MKSRIKFPAPPGKEEKDKKTDSIQPHRCHLSFCHYEPAKQHNDPDSRVSDPSLRCFVTTSFVQAWPARLWLGGKPWWADSGEYRTCLAWTESALPWLVNWGSWLRPCRSRSPCRRPPRWSTACSRWRTTCVSAASTRQSGCWEPTPRRWLCWTAQTCWMKQTWENSLRQNVKSLFTLNRLN